MAKTKISVTVDSVLVEKVDKLELDASRSEIVEMALEQWLRVRKAESLGSSHRRLLPGPRREGPGRGRRVGGVVRVGGRRDLGLSAFPQRGCLYWGTDSQRARPETEARARDLGRRAKQVCRRRPRGPVLHDGAVRAYACPAPQGARLVSNAARCSSASRLRRCRRASCYRLRSGDRCPSAYSSRSRSACCAPSAFLLASS